MSDIERAAKKLEEVNERMKRLLALAEKADREGTGSPALLSTAEALTRDLVKARAEYDAAIMRNALSLEAERARRRGDRKSAELLEARHASFKPSILLPPSTPRMSGEESIGGFFSKIGKGFKAAGDFVRKNKKDITGFALLGPAYLNIRNPKETAIVGAALFTGGLAAGAIAGVGAASSQLAKKSPPPEDSPVPAVTDDPARPSLTPEQTAAALEIDAATKNLEMAQKNKDSVAIQAGIARLEKAVKAGQEFTTPEVKKSDLQPQEDNTALYLAGGLGVAVLALLIWRSS